MFVLASTPTQLVAFTLSVDVFFAVLHTQTHYFRTTTANATILAVTECDRISKYLSAFCTNVINLVLECMVYLLENDIFLDIRSTYAHENAAIIWVVKVRLGRAIL